MKLLGLITVFALVCAGCTVSHRSEVIDTDKLGGYASGTYDSKSNGPTGKVTVGASGSAPARPVPALAPGGCAWKPDPRQVALMSLPGPLP